MQNTENKKTKKDKKDKKTKKQKKCIICNKKLSLTDQKCRCGIIFCSRHRLPEQHNCTYDFKTEKMDQNKCGLGGGAFKKIIKI